MANKRMFYAVYAAGFSKLGGHANHHFTPVHGLQSVGVTTRFNLEQVFEIGQISLYENIENVPDVEVQMEKVLDGYPLLYHLGTNGATSATLSGRSNIKSMIGISYYTDTQDSASGVPLKQCLVSGVFPSQLNYNFPTEGNFTESITFVGNNKTWRADGAVTGFMPTFNNTDSPLAGLASGNVQRRDDIIFGTGSDACKLPLDLPGIDQSGFNTQDSAGDFNAHIQSIRVSCNLGREQLFELGRRGPYHRFVNFPVEVRSDFEMYCQTGDHVQADEFAVSNVTDRTIIIRTKDGTNINLGTKNKLNNITETGGNAGQRGGNRTITFSYTNFNDMTVTHPADPSGL